MLNLGTTHPVARTKHRCDSCGRLITPKTRYVRARIVDGGEAWVWKAHEDCQAAGLLLSKLGHEDGDGCLLSVYDMDPEDQAIIRTHDPALAERLWPRGEEFDE